MNDETRVTTSKITARAMFRFTRKDLCFLVVALVIGALGIASYVASSRDRELAEARTALSNCVQIEVIKTEIRNTILGSIARTTHTSYFKEHPVELEAAIEDTHRSAERFSAKDCYKLPIVRDAHLVPPKKG